MLSQFSSWIVNVYLNDMLRKCNAYNVINRSMAWAISKWNRKIRKKANRGNLQKRTTWVCIPRISPSGPQTHLFTDIAASFNNAVWEHNEYQVKWVRWFSCLFSVFHYSILSKKIEQSTCKGIEAARSQTLKGLCANLSRDPTSQRLISPTFVPTTVHSSVA